MIDPHETRRVSPLLILQRLPGRRLDRVPRRRVPLVRVRPRRVRRALLHRRFEGCHQLLPRRVRLVRHLERRSVGDRVRRRPDPDDDHVPQPLSGAGRTEADLGCYERDGSRGAHTRAQRAPRVAIQAGRHVQRLATQFEWLSFHFAISIGLCIIHCIWLMPFAA